MFAILFEVLLIQIQGEILHFAGCEGGGGLRRTKIVNKHFVNKQAFPNSRACSAPPSQSVTKGSFGKRVFQRGMILKSRFAVEKEEESDHSLANLVSQLMEMQEKYIYIYRYG